MKNVNFPMICLFFTLILSLFNEATCNFKILNVKENKSLLNNSFLIFSKNINKLRCLNTCKSSSNCKTVLFNEKNLECKGYSTEHYFENDAEKSEIQIYALQEENGELINTYYSKTPLTRC